MLKITKTFLVWLKMEMEVGFIVYDQDSRVKDRCKTESKAVRGNITKRQFQTRFQQQDRI